jgi:ABC-type multidrug transport system ATPase subunit
MHTLEFDSIFLEFGFHRVLSDVHMIGRTGRIVGILGRNGSGKSCLMKVVAGVLTASCQSIRYNRQPLMGNFVRKKLVSYLPQHDLIPSFLTVAEATRFYQAEEHELQHYFPDWQQMRTMKSAQLSGGQRRHLEVLLVLFAPHPFCLLDEPFSGLSPLQIEVLQHALQIAKNKKGIFITDHLHRQVRAVADDLYLLTNGCTEPVLDDVQLIRGGYLPSGV